MPRKIKRPDREVVEAGAHLLSEMLGIPDMPQDMKTYFREEAVKVATKRGGGKPFVYAISIIAAAFGSDMSEWEDLVYTKTSGRGTRG